jgi:hypothetical protein
MKKSRYSLKPFEPGQIWEVADTRLQISQVGKRLVHYKRYKVAARGVPTSLAAIPELEKFLRQHRAILVQE